ncbi:hypothetical protein DYBT9623_00055 [Dyadobacter sp. CECT 9623]|uniref:Uncharacterized protein n=1 Tax=Dyadobacter linearis TaxID=2823330 RepID=A0ABM8UIT8_9BACT|nr:hypothetical protein [Dyadobacter sp. CECT 9623]CAG5067335.1 hypothetical protein DYBT9623_00055 [Dyadobacter sp. CECT 9623]
MKKLNCSAIFLSLVYGLLVMALSCTDHEVPVENLPESKCKATDGSDRLYPCEFVIEKITLLGAGGTELGSVTGSMQSAVVSRFAAKANSNNGYVVGSPGYATFDFRITLKRVATPSFPVNAGYLIGFTHNSAGKAILHTPAFAGDTYGERTKLGAPVALDMAVGETRDVIVELGIPYTLVNAGPSGVVPEMLFSYTSFFVDNDVTTLKFNRLTIPYFYVGSVTEAFYEKLQIRVTN